MPMVMTLTGRFLVLSLAFCASCVGDIAEPGDPSSDGTKAGEIDSRGVPALRPESAAKMGLRRLTVDEYDNTLCDLLGDCTRPGSSRLPQDVLAPFTDASSQQEQIGESLISSVEFLAIDLAASLRKDRARWDRVV